VILRTLAPAKLNLALEVLGRRPDGYHEIRSVVQTIDLADTVEVEPAETLSVDARGLDLPSEQNLAFRAALALKERFGVRAGAAIRIAKRIPESAGLGGGSSDAAAVLRLLDCLWGLSLSVSELSETAAAIGSDVPLFLAGPAALVEGRGERAHPTSPLQQGAFALVTPQWQHPEKTRAVYSALRPTEYGTGHRAATLAQLLESGRLPCTMHCVNDLFPAARRVFPLLRELELALFGLGRWFSLAGAGPTLFSLEPSKADAVSRAWIVAHYDELPLFTGRRYPVLAGLPIKTAQPLAALPPIECLS
jgi:4-diphosphocytidyl-2-C-methyl-D-erythritol kinase